MFHGIFFDKQAELTFIVIVAVHSNQGSAAMWWSEQVDREAEQKRLAKYRQKKGRRWVDQRLKDTIATTCFPAAMRRRRHY